MRRNKEQLGEQRINGQMHVMQKIISTAMYYRRGCTKMVISKKLSIKNKIYKLWTPI